VLVFQWTRISETATHQDVVLLSSGGINTVLLDLSIEALKTSENGGMPAP
jgi:hypothetical protein